MEFFKNIELSFEQVQCIARGLHAIASTDGVHEREEQLIREFYEACRPAGSPSYADAMKTPFAIDEALTQLKNAEVRRLFIKTGWLLAFADGKLTAPEQNKIGELAKALHVSDADVAELQGQVKEFLLGQLTHIKNTDALADIAKSLKVV